MNEPAHKLSTTFAEYVRLEQTSEVKHEFLNGEIFAMSGGTPEHADLAASVIRELGNQLRGRPCRVYTSDLRIRVLATGLGTYPDASVVCGKPERDPADPNTVVNPVVLIEVLSDSSERYDRGEKFAHYRRIPSLQEYVLVSQLEPRIEVFRRNDDGTWTWSEALTPGSVTLASIQCSLSVDTVYAGVFGEEASG